MNPILSDEAIKEMMANAQRTIEERKRQIGIVQQVPTPRPFMASVPPVSIKYQKPEPLILRPALQPDLLEEKKARVAELQAAVAARLARPLPLLLDGEGRAIDAGGNALGLPTHIPTLKANLRAQRKPEPVKPRPPTPPNNIYFDDRLGPSKGRKRKELHFNEPGKFTAAAAKLRRHAQLERLQAEIADKARRTGISTAARLAKLSGAVLSSEATQTQEYIPKIEWWDALLLEENEVTPLSYDSPVKSEAITNLIEHPAQIRCPTEPNNPVFLPIFLTKKEKKKLRRVNRRETWKEKQEKIRLGLDPAPQAKVRISNLMRVLGIEAVQDPTKVEAHVRQQMAKRQKTHEESNANRKLTGEQKKDKKLRKIKEDTSSGVHVSVYRLDDFSSMAKRFKVETNAKQLQMTGCVLLHRECNVIVVEGGPKQQKKFKRLMLHRIKWDEDPVKDKEGMWNKCVLVWEGTQKERAFADLKFKSVQTEAAAREFFKKHLVHHFYDLALSGTVLETIDTV